jgi:nitroreductase
MIEELVKRNRSYRRFYEDFSIGREVLTELVDCARICPSAGNRQVLKYLVFNEPEWNKRIFPQLSWAGYLADWPGPEPGERPAAYIVILGDTDVHPGFDCDHGIAAQTIMLSAVEKGLGGCIVGSIARQELRRVLQTPHHLEILLVLALGKPKEEVVLEAVDASGSIKYWRDGQGVHHVPKRSLSEILLNPD